MWIRELGVSIVDDTEFSSELDPTKCALGQWLTTFETENDR